MEDLQEMQPLYRLGHWKEMLLGLELDSGGVIGFKRMNPSENKPGM